MVRRSAGRAPRLLHRSVGDAFDKLVRDEGDGPGHPTLIGRLVLFLGWIPRGRGKVPERSRPKGISAGELAADLARQRQRFTATQFALFSSLIAIPRTFANAITGILIEGIGPDDGLYYRLFGEFGDLGYTNFFLLCTASVIPGMVLLFWVAPWNAEPEPPSEGSE